MLKTILIDDELAALESLAIDLKKHCDDDVSIVAKCNSPLAGLKAIKQHQPDLVFLDVQMPEMTGFELLDFLGATNFHVVFVSAFDQYALQAFEKSAIHYLLKPVAKEKLQEAIERVKTQRQKVSPEHLQVLIENMQPHPTRQRIAVTTFTGIQFLSTETLMYCVAASGGTNLFLNHKDREIFSPKSLKEIQKILPTEKFLRVHNSHIINKDFVDQYFAGDTSSVKMQDGTSLNIARMKKKEFLRWVGLSDVK